ncbi:hypothetical protein B7P43_G03741 [Cryptotermes secundus]|uniref:Uncharacterized protein n=1 Tax=Cryptotermes secundus TaxID=105785 RepID=A0A2J7R1Y5_9NEOP|nr:hypothetical protein B7P43_G03741 [Cryptotermes secundus]
MICIICNHSELKTSIVCPTKAGHQQSICLEYSSCPCFLQTAPHEKFKVAVVVETVTAN